MYVIGVDIGGTNLRIGLVDGQGHLLSCQRVPQGDVLKGDAPAALGAFIRQYIQASGKGAEIAAIGLGMPATLNRERTAVLSAPNIHGFDGVEVPAALQQETGLLVFMEKDVNLLLYNDLCRYDLLDEDVVTGCYVGTGLGNANYIDGRFYSGHNGAAGELGHIPVWHYHEVCACGNSGCVETLVAGKGLEQLQARAFPEIPVGRLFMDAAESPLIEDYIQALSLPLAAAVNILDPSVLVLGGGVISAAGFPREKLESLIRRHARKPYPEKNLRILFAQDAGENGVTGAGRYAVSRLNGAEKR